MSTKATLVLAAVLIALGGCERDADVASRNLSQDADNFKIPRRVIFYNGISDKYMLEIQGYCSIANGQTNNSIAVTCKVEGGYKKHLLGRSDNVTYFVEQLTAKDVSTNFYRVTFKPSVILPDIELR